MKNIQKNLKIVVGSQWGDEGKGKWVDVLSNDCDIVARFQGGNNAGHTIYINSEKHVLHQLPSGVFKNKISVLGAGVVINPVALFEEMEKIKNKVSLTAQNLWLSSRAHVISPWHIFQDGQRESSTAQPIGTTKRGIGPTYADKASRVGIRMGSYVDDHCRMGWIENLKQESPKFKEFYEQHKDEMARFHEVAAYLKKFVTDSERQILENIKSGKNVLAEGAQGTLLDINFGTYPYVTSNSTISSGALASLGLPPSCVGDVIGIGKAYVTRVGEGPFPTELFDDVGKGIAQKGHEFGATTGRPRRCGWLDLVALKYAVDINGITNLIINKFDVLNELDTIKFATAYEHPTLGKIDYFPTEIKTLAECKPVYESTPGWKKEIRGLRSYDIPSELLKYVEIIESYCQSKVCLIGTGPGPDDYLDLN